MAEGQDDLKTGIQETSERIGETVEAIGQKAEIRGRAQGRMSRIVSGRKPMIVAAAGLAGGMIALRMVRARARKPAVT